jgi:hypothetical protein
MLERWIIRGGIIFGLVSLFKLLQKPKRQLWLSYFVINGMINYIFDHTLDSKKRISCVAQITRLSKSFGYSFGFNEVVQRSNYVEVNP